MLGIGLPKQSRFCPLQPRNVDYPSIPSVFSTGNFSNLRPSYIETTQDTANNCGSVDLFNDITNEKTGNALHELLKLKCSFHLAAFNGHKLNQVG